MILSKKMIVRILSVFFGLLFLLVAVWLARSFFSMKSNTPHLKTEIDLEEDIFAKKVLPESTTKEGKYILYKYPVSFFDISFEKDEYVLSTLAVNFEEYFEDVENAKFRYSLEKEKGEFDFTQLEWMQPVYLTRMYRVENNFKYFVEYSLCTLREFFGKEGKYGKGICVIERDLSKWEIEII